MLTSSGVFSMLTVADRGKGGGGKFAKILLTSYVNAPYVTGKLFAREEENSGIGQYSVAAYDTTCYGVTFLKGWTLRRRTLRRNLPNFYCCLHFGLIT